MGERKVNFIPFNQAINLNGKIDFAEMIMNVVIFIPLGIYAGMLFRKWMVIIFVFMFFVTSLIVEGLQFLLRVGAFDITDTITNTLGGIIGLMIFKAMEKLFTNSVQAQKSINIIAAIGTGLMILFFVLLKTNNLWIRYQ
jgi:glycopeptide antibiotics resistance protein